MWGGSPETVTRLGFIIRLKITLDKNIEISPDKALDELKTMHKVYLGDSRHVFKISRVVALTKRQETILKAVNSKLLASEN